jgi:hypothetical protein
LASAIHGRAVWQSELRQVILLQDLAGREMVTKFQVI